MELKRYAMLLWRWSWLIVLGAVLGGSAGLGVSWRTVPVYEASTTLLISQARDSNGMLDYNALVSGEMLAKTYAELMRKRPVLEEVAANLKLDGDPDELAGVVKITPVRETQLLVLTVTHTDPRRAADIANEIVSVFGRQNQSLQTSRYTDTKQSLERELAKVQLDIDRTQAALTALKSATSPSDIAERDRLQALLAQYRDSYATLLRSLGDVQLAEVQSTDTLSVAEPARPQTDPVRPRTARNTLLAALVGALLALGIAFLIENLDDRVKSSDQVTEMAGVMTLGTIGRIPEPDNMLVTVRAAQSPFAEAYRMLRVNLDFSAIDDPIRSIAVTSSSPEEGKSTTIANLAVAIAQTGKRVILVDTDLRRPTIHKLFDLSNERGVTTALLNSGERSVANNLVRPGIRNLQVMPSGPIPPNPAELLGSQRMVTLIETLKSHADVVLFDTPPLLLFADASLLAQACDGTLLVVRAKSTRLNTLLQAKERLAQSGARLLGVVLNRVATPRRSQQSYYYYYGDDARRQGSYDLVGWRSRLSLLRKSRERDEPVLHNPVQWDDDAGDVGGQEAYPASQNATSLAVQPTSANGRQGSVSAAVTIGQAPAIDGHPSKNGHGNHLTQEQ